MVRWAGTTLLALAVIAGISTARVDDATVRAYDQPVPASARLYTVALTVLDDETSGPLAGAEVRVLNYDDASRHNFRTDPRGRLRIECASLKDEPSASIEVRQNGYVPLIDGWGFGEGTKPPDALTLRLRRGTTMGGIVVAAANRPVEGVTVVMTVTKCGLGGRPDHPTGHEMYFQVPSRTGPDGRWRTDSVPPGAEVVSLQLIHPDFVSDECTTPGRPGRTPKIEALRDQSDRQVLLKGVKISGQVIDDQGRPIGGARVVDSTRGLSADEYVWRTVTDAQGRFHLHLPRDRKVRLIVVSRGHQPLAQEVSPDPDHSSVNFPMLPGKRLRGRVVDPLGRPIAEASVLILSMSPERNWYFSRRTDSQGRFEWDSAPEEPIGTHINAQGFLRVGLFSMTATDEENVVTLKPAIDVRVHAVDARTGKAIPRFRVRIATQEPGAKEWTWGLLTGRSAPKKFQAMLDAAKGPYQVEISADGYVPSILQLRAEQTVLRDVVRLDKGPEVTSLDFRPPIALVDTPKEPVPGDKSAKRGRIDRR